MTQVALGSVKVQKVAGVQTYNSPAKSKKQKELLSDLKICVVQKYVVYKESAQLKNAVRLLNCCVSAILTVKLFIGPTYAA